MNDKDYDGFVDAWARAWDLYGKAITPGALDLAFNALAHYELHEVTEALTRHVRDPDTGQYAPKPADVVRMIEGGKTDRAHLAWAKVEKAARHVGCYDTVCFDDATINAVLADMGGWVSLCMTTDKEWPFKGNEFVKRYQAYLLRGGPGKSYPGTLPGIAERDNAYAGLPEHHQACTYIGNQAKALEVQAGANDFASGIETITTYIPPFIPNDSLVRIEHSKGQVKLKVEPPAGGSGGGGDPDRSAGGGGGGE